MALSVYLRVPHAPVLYHRRILLLQEIPHRRGHLRQETHQGTLLALCEVGRLLPDPPQLDVRLNEVYGNETGGVLHPWSAHQMQQNLWTIFTAMGGYDAFLCGAFWFFRGLFVASILYLIIYKVIDLGLSNLSRRVGWVNTNATPYLICLIMLLLCGWKTWEGLRVISLVQGGYRDMMGCFFFGL